jgi:hypothetical protein
VAEPGVHEASRRGLSRFLADHEACGRGFDIQRREGSGGSIVRVVCGGCGKAFEYPAAGDAGLLPDQPVARGVSQRLLSREGRSPEPTAAVPGNSGTTGVPPVDRDPPKRPLNVPGWIWVALIGALIGGGLLLVVLGVASDSGTSESTPAPSASVASPPVALPTTPTKPTKPTKVQKPRNRLDRRRLAERVSIGIPAGWNAGVEGSAVSVAALNGRGEVQVYFEHGAKPDDQLMRESRAFLLQRHTGARVAGIGPTHLGGREVRRVRVIYSTGTESATVLVAGGYSYLILERLSKPFSADLRRMTDAVVASFRPV